jgi:hypothetical protein
MTSAITRFSRDVLGFNLYPKQADIVETIYRDDVRVAVLRLGRRSGKGRIAALVAAFEATVNADVHLAAVQPGEQAAIVVIGSSQRQARIVHGYIKGFLRAPVLAPLVVKETADSIELSNGIVILTLPCHAASPRGLAVAVAILDEVAWWAGSDGSVLDPDEIWQAVVPATAQFPAGRVMVLSTPRFAGGWFANLCQQAESGQFPDMRGWHATTAEMNPAIPASFLARERAKDPVAFRREYEAAFEASISAVFDADLVRSAVTDRDANAPAPGANYVLALDPAFTGDRFTAVLGHREPSGSIVVDRVREWIGTKASPVGFDAVLDEVAVLVAAYHGARVLTDQYAAEPIRQGLVARGIRVEATPWTNDSKLNAVAAVRKALYAGHLDLPRHRELIAELVSLEQRPTPSGRPRIAAPGRSHDDFATALMALVADLGAESPPPTGGTVEAAPGAYHAARHQRGFWSSSRIGMMAPALTNRR